jgi:hypothetical protein
LSNSYLVGDVRIEPSHPDARVADVRFQGVFPGVAMRVDVHAWDFNGRLQWGSDDGRFWNRPSFAFMTGEGCVTGDLSIGSGGLKRHVRLVEVCGEYAGFQAVVHKKAQDVIEELGARISGCRTGGMLNAVSVVKDGRVLRLDPDVVAARPVCT